MTAMYFEDFEIGETLSTAARTITEADVIGFAGISGDFNPIHTDREHCKTTAFGEPIAHGLLVLSVASGLGVQTGIFTGTNLALLGVEDWKFTGVVKFGDTIHMESTVVEARRASKGDRGVVKLRQEIKNQHGDVVQTGVFVSLMAARTSEPAKGSA